MAMASFVGFPFWKWLYSRSASTALQNRTKALVETNPQLQLAWTIALEDDLLTYSEAKLLVEAAREKVDPNE